MKINSRAFMNMTKGHYYKILQHGLIEREKPVKYPNYMLFPLLAFFDFVINIIIRFKIFNLKFLFNQYPIHATNQHFAISATPQSAHLLALLLFFSPLFLSIKRNGLCLRFITLHQPQAESAAKKGTK